MKKSETANEDETSVAGVERGQLSRQSILRTALAIVDRDGLTGLTVRKLAAQLGKSPMAIYRYYENKAAIVHDLVDLVVGDYEVTAHQEADWIEWIVTSFSKMRFALCAHPGIIPLLDGATYQGRNAMAVMEEVLGRLRGAGIEAEQAAQLFHTLMAFTVGAVVIMNDESRREVVGRAVDGEEQLRQQQLQFQMMHSAQFPNLVELAPHLARYSGDEPFRQVIRRMVPTLRG